MPSQERPQSRGEEIANTLSHGIALAAALVGLPFLLLAAGPHLLGTSVFAATLLLLYLSSTLYHALPAGRAKQLWLQVDYGAIYFFIAGSYTPFALSAVSGVWGWTLFALVWLLAIAGTALKLLGRLSHPWLSTGLYVAMGWLVLVAAVPLVGHLSAAGLAWLVAGGGWRGVYGGGGLFCTGRTVAVCTCGVAWFCGAGQRLPCLRGAVTFLKPNGHAASGYVGSNKVFP